MKNFKKIIVAFALMCIIATLGLFAACSSYGKSDKEYWFSDYSATFIEYDESANSGAGNIDEAGNVWEFTVKSDCAVTISVRLDTDNFTSTAYFYVNDAQVQSDSSTGVYSYVYSNLMLKKGDKLKLRAFWVYSLYTNDTGFTLSYFVVGDSEGDWVVSL